MKRHSESVTPHRAQMPRTLYLGANNRMPQTGSLDITILLQIARDNTHRNVSTIDPVAIRLDIQFAWKRPWAATIIESTKSRFDFPHCQQPFHSRQINMTNDTMQKNGETREKENKKRRTKKKFRTHEVDRRKVMEKWRGMIGGVYTRRKGSERGL